MSFVIFYSWQSDLPNRTNRSFIQTALQKAVKDLTRDEEIKVEPRIDEATAGVPGAPDISQTIFKKIEECQLFICDVSFVNDGEPIIEEDQANPDGGEDDTSSGNIAKKRITPNPNVMIEAGYALRSLGFERVVFVLNSAYGPVEALPFDIRPRRIIQYQAPFDTEDLKQTRENLQKELDRAIRSVISHHERDLQNKIAQASTPIGPTLFERTVDAIENHSPRQTSLIHEYMAHLVLTLDGCVPDWNSAEESGIPPDETFLKLIELPSETIMQFTSLVRTIASCKALDAARAIYKAFSLVVARYSPQGEEPNSSTRNIEFDFFRFFGHELFVIFFAALIENQCWHIIDQLLSDHIYISGYRYSQSPMLHFYKVSDGIRLLDSRKIRTGSNRISLHADLLNSRHGKGGILSQVTAENFMEADYFLFLRSVVEEGAKQDWSMWKAFSTLHMGSKAPRFLIESEKISYAEKIAPALGLNNTLNMPERIRTACPLIGKIFPTSYGFDPLTYFKFDEIASRL